MLATFAVLDNQKNHYGGTISVFKKEEVEVRKCGCDVMLGLRLYVVFIERYLTQWYDHQQIEVHKNYSRYTAILKHKCNTF